ncbi:MAG TPA: histidine kinase [Marmoricola sp.]|nr:histidine kinase [Marmoricola sp.]
MHDTRRRSGLVPRALQGMLVRPFAGVLCVPVACAGLVLALGPGRRSLDGLLHDNVLNNVVNAVALGILAAVLLWLRPRNRVGWLVLGIAWCNGLAILGEGWALASYHASLPARSVAAWLASWPWALGLLAGPLLLPLLYPTGRTTSRFAHRLAVAIAATTAVVAACLSLLDGAYDGAVPGHRLGANPLSQGHLQQPLGAAAVVAATVALLLGVVGWGHTVRRLWHARSPEREQLVWLLVVAVPLLVVAPLGKPWLSFAVQAVTPVLLLVGIVHHDLFDIKRVLRSGLVYAVLTLVAVAAYFGIVALITSLTPPGTVPSLFAVAAVALVVVPLHRWLQRLVGRLVYGDRRDPVRALARMSAGVRGDTGDPSAMLPLLGGVAQALRSPYVAVVTPDGTTLAEIGQHVAPDRLHRTSLSWVGETVGELLVAPRTDLDRFGAADRRLLDALSGPVAAAVRAAHAARELAASRARVLAVREGERSRLRADLHDGLGPALSGVSLGLEAAAASLGSHPRRVPEILGVLRREVDQLVGEVRSIIDDLGPDRVDLLETLRGQVEAVAATGQAVELRHAGLDTPVPLEVAVVAQRIAGEALSNAVRHATASLIRVSLTGDLAALTVEVADDGCGTVAPRPGGVGLESMRRRAESVGGLLALTAVPGVGTTVLATLPVGVR